MDCGFFLLIQDTRQWIRFRNEDLFWVNWCYCSKFAGMKPKFDRAAFKEKLEAQTAFPTLYMFKFIVLNGMEDQVAALLPKNKMTLKESSKGKYVSATIKAMMPNAEAILDVYDRAAKIKGVISL
jgi:putative lipoic acid-binding regulatory protein